MIVLDAAEMEALGEKIGRQLRGSEIIELIGDVGTGKTTLTHGIAKGLDIKDDIQSPSFTISRNYEARDNLTLNHYDFYRLNDAGIMNLEIAESSSDPNNITIIEWGESIRSAIPAEHIKITINYLPDKGRDINFQIPQKYHYILNKK